MTITTITLILVVSAFVTTIAAAMGRAPVWVPLFLLCVVDLLSLKRP